MFTKENTQGFSAVDLAIMNDAMAVLISRGLNAESAHDRINNNWQAANNTVESLTRA